MHDTVAYISRQGIRKSIPKEIKETRLKADVCHSAISRIIIKAPLTIANIILQCRQEVSTLVFNCILYYAGTRSRRHKATVTARRAELVERIAEVDETVGELFLMEEPVDSETLKGGIRRATLALKFVPVFMGR